MKRLSAALAAASLCLAPCGALAGTKSIKVPDYTLPADKPVSIVVIAPDVQVGTLTTGGMAEPNADWTNASRANIFKALEEHQKGLGSEVRLLGDQDGEAAELVADYNALHRAVADAILLHKFLGAKLPTKKDRFDWSLGDGTGKLAELSGNNYALFLYARDNFASDGRKAMQAAGLLGCLVGFCVIASGGQHVAYASLVELSSGNVVWFNVLRGSEGDVREPAGAKAMVEALMLSLPTKPGASGQIGASGSSK